MIIRSQQKQRSVFAPFALLMSSGPARVCLAEEFRIEIAKEISRSNRRSSRREFAIVQFPGLRHGISEDVLRLVANRSGGRIRFSDTMGWLENRFAILLPETNRHGAQRLAHELSERLTGESRLETQVSVYPWDDESISLANELSSSEDAEEDWPRTDISTGRVSDSTAGHGVAADRRNQETAKNRISHFVQSHQTPWWKRFVDVVGASIGLIVLSPVLLVAAIAIKLDSPGPVLFRQLREGKDGRIFGIWKFRTMVIDAEARKDSLRFKNEQDGPAFKLSDDPRVTSVGKYLRKSCVDELPQLINIFMGQMSLVGPRPLPVDESHHCKLWHRVRLTVLPGLTCTWQIRGGRDTRFDEWMRMDLEYIERQSFWFDMKLIIRTAVVAILHRGSV